MSFLIIRFPESDLDFPEIWRVADGRWILCGALGQFQPDVDDNKVIAIVAPALAICSWISLPDLEPRQAEGVAKLRVSNHVLGPVHVVARHCDTEIVCAAISPDVMTCGINQLAKYGLDPDIITPFGLAIAGTAEHVVRAEFDGMAVLRGTGFAAPDETIFRDLIAADKAVVDIDAESMRAMLLDMCQAPLVNLRAGSFVRKVRTVWATEMQRAWIVRLTVALLVATILLSIVTLTKYWSATAAEDDRALIAARKIDPSIEDIAQAEMQLDRKLQQKGFAKGRFGALSAGLWHAVQSAPNVKAREMRYGKDGILVAVLAAPDANSLNKVLIAIQQDGFRVTATPRQDSSGSTLVDLTMRMP